MTGPNRERRVLTPQDIHQRAVSGETTTGLRESRVAVETWLDDSLELRSDGDGMTFRGYAAVFDSWSEDLGGFREKIRPGSFTKSIGEKRAIKMFWNHNPDIPLGSTRSSLALSEDKKGLLSEGRLPETTHGRDMATLVRDKIVDSMSFGFNTIKDDWQGDYTERELIEVKLWEVSPVTGWPAYPKTSASVRELADELGTNPDLLAEAFTTLREQGGQLTDEQHALLIELINARHTRQVVIDTPLLDEWQKRIAALSI